LGEEVEQLVPELGSSLNEGAFVVGQAGTSEMRLLLAEQSPVAEKAL